MSVKLHRGYFGVALAVAIGFACSAALAQKKNTIQDLMNLGSGLGQATSSEALANGLQIQRRTYGTLGDSHLDQQLDGVLQEIRRAAGPNAPQAIIRATPDPAFRAFTTPDGYIFLAYGVLQSVQSRDELAALIAHEYAHVLLEHAKPSDGRKTLDSLSGAMNLYSDYRYRDAKDVSVDSELRALAAAGVAMEVIQSGTMPKRGRKHENQADTKAVDLLVDAGYNLVGMLDLLSRMESWEAAQDAAYERQRGAMVDIKKPADEALSNGDVEGATTHVVVGGMVNLWSKGIGAVNSGLRSARREHQSAEKRTENVLAYVDSEHTEAERPELRELPWLNSPKTRALFQGVDKTHAFVASVAAGDVKEMTRLRSEVMASAAASTPYARYSLMQVFSVQKGRASSLPGIRAEVTREDSLFPSHLLALDILQMHVSAKEQVTALEQSRQILGDPPELLPHAVAIYRRAGDTQKMEEAYSRCLGTSSGGLSQACARARA